MRGEQAADDICGDESEAAADKDPFAAGGSNNLFKVG